MNNDELQLARKKYNKLLKERNEKIKNQEIELKELSSDQRVQKYIVLSDELSVEGKNNSKNMVIDDSFDEIAKNTKSLANIYVFIGFYASANVNFLSPIRITNPSVRYKYFVNLETTEIVVVEKDNLEFEKNKHLIYFDDPKNSHNIPFYERKFKELRRKYFEYLVNNSQEESIKQLKKR